MMGKQSHCFWGICLAASVLLSACAGSEARPVKETSQSAEETSEAEETAVGLSEAVMADSQSGTSLWEQEEINSLDEDEWLWRYLDDPVGLSEIDGFRWLEPDYDDSRWLEGTGGFGAYDGRKEDFDEYETDICLRQYLPDGDNIPTYCFRAVFDGTGVEESDKYEFTFAYDDAIVVYLNGTAVLSGNTPEAEYESFQSYGCESVCGNPITSALILDGQQILPGTNVLAVELHQANETSSDIYFGLRGIQDYANKIAQIRNETVCLGIGEDETQRLVTWQGQGESGYVEVAEGEAGADFPKERQTFQAEAVYKNDWETSTFRAVLTDLSPGKTYLYRVCDSSESDVYSFTVPNSADSSFIVCGDPQIVRADEKKPMEIYESLIDYAMDGQKPEFILTLGDQSDKADDEGLFLQYMSTDLSHEVPLAAIVGNHERGADLFSRFFYMPNMDDAAAGDAGDMGGDYWFGWDHTLFLCMNSNCKDMEIHEDFLRKAKESYVERFGEPDWIVAAFHHSIFSAGNHAMDDDVAERRSQYVPIFEELGVDLVFTGHDHVYVRTYSMDGESPIPDDDGEIQDSDAIVYFTLNSSTGTKFYDLYEGELDYAAVRAQNWEACMTRVDLDSERAVITTYSRNEDGTIEVLDELTVNK